MPTLAELVAPNLHVALIHYPLGLLVVGLFLELFSFLWPTSTARVAGWWLIALGALSSVVAAFSGIYALPAIARVDLDGRWADARAASPVLSDPAIWHALKMHTIYQSTASGVAALAVVLWIGCGDRARRALRWPTLGVLLLCVGGMMTGAWLGGEAIYKHGVGVERGWPASQAEAAPTKLEQLFPPVELHVVMAGVAVAIALGAIGLSFRKLALLSSPPLAAANEHASTDLARLLNPNLEVSVAPAVPASKFWLVAFLIAAVTSLGGWFVLARSADVFASAHGHYNLVPKLLWTQVKPEPTQKVNRRLVHLVAGGTIIVLPLFLAMLARWAPRQRMILAICTFVLMAAVAAQVWFGILLLYDTADGPINRFNPATAADVSPTTMPTTAPVS